MDWLKILSAVALGAMLVFLFPRARQMMNDSPAAQPGDWGAALVPIVLVIGFVLLLMSLV